MAQEGLLIQVSGVDDAEGRVRVQFGEERIARRRRDGTPIRHDLRGNAFETRATLDNLERHVQPSRARYAPEKCAYSVYTEIVTLFREAREEGRCQPRAPLNTTMFDLELWLVTLDPVGWKLGPCNVFTVQKTAKSTQSSLHPKKDTSRSTLQTIMQTLKTKV